MFRAALDRNLSILADLRVWWIKGLNGQDERDAAEWYYTLIRSNRNSEEGMQEVAWWGCGCRECRRANPPPSVAPVPAPQQPQVATGQQSTTAPANKPSPEAKQDERPKPATHTRAALGASGPFFAQPTAASRARALRADIRTVWIHPTSKLHLESGFSSARSTARWRSRGAWPLMRARPRNTGGRRLARSRRRGRRRRRPRRRPRKRLRKLSQRRPRGSHVSLIHSLHCSRWF